VSIDKLEYTPVKISDRLAVFIRHVIELNKHGAGAFEIFKPEIVFGTFEP
jgi:hypothetical protein